MMSLSAWLRRASERVWRYQDGAHQEAKPPDNRDALAAFIARTIEIDAILARLTELSDARLTELSDAHFNLAPDDVSCSAVGTLGCYLDGLRKISDAAFREGERAA